MSLWCDPGQLIGLQFSFSVELICSLGKFLYRNGDHIPPWHSPGCSVWTSCAVFTDFKLLLTYIIQDTGFEFPLLTFLPMCCSVSSAYSSYFCFEAWIHQSERSLWVCTRNTLSRLKLQQFCQLSDWPVKLSALLKLTKKKKVGYKKEPLCDTDATSPARPAFPLLCGLCCFTFEETGWDFNKNRINSRPLHLSPKRTPVTIFSSI